MMIYKMISVSTGHVSESTARWLDQQGTVNAVAFLTRRHASIHMGSHGYGWFVHCHASGIENYPQDLVKVIEWAIKKGCDYINFDSAGKRHKALKFYSW